MNTDRLKFRVWDCDRKEYYDGFVLATDGVLWYAEMGLPDDEIMDKELYVVEQCTGLRDANGKLIYEGDILRSSDGSNYSVEYDLHYARFLRRGVFHNGNCFFAELNSTKAENFLRVIGNIHENPELLEGNK